jgi:hypothetical protein
MVPLGTVVAARNVDGPLVVTRYNMYPAAAVNGGNLPGVSTGTVIDKTEALGRQDLPEGMAFEWTELIYLQIQAGGGAAFAFVGAVVLVFLVLAAQYESWSLPLSIILVVPMCLLCALGGVLLARLDVNIFVQVGFVVLVGLACKNAIFIVQFARDRQQEGEAPRQAAVEAATVRLRPPLLRHLVPRRPEVVRADVADQSRLAEVAYHQVARLLVVRAGPRRQLAGVHQGLLGVQEGVGRVLDRNPFHVRPGLGPVCRASFCPRYFARAPSGSAHGPRQWILPRNFLHQYPAACAVSGNSG